MDRETQRALTAHTKETKDYVDTRCGRLETGMATFMEMGHIDRLGWVLFGATWLEKRWLKRVAKRAQAVAE